MTDLKLSALPNSTTIVDADQFYINSSGTSERIDASLVQQFIKEQKVSSITLRIINDGGTLKHAMFGGMATGGTGSFLDRINGSPTATLTATPTGNDATTAFAAGGKISSADPFEFDFDTAAQSGSDGIGVVRISRNRTGTHLIPYSFMNGRNINGVTHPRLVLQFFDAPSGGNFNLNTTNIASGEEFYVQIFAYLK